MGAVGRKAVDALGARMTATAERFWHESDATHALLIKRADGLIGYTEGTPEEEELRRGTVLGRRYPTRRHGAARSDR